MNAIVLAAGNSTRMQSETSKMLHVLIDKPIIMYVIETLQEMGIHNIVCVVNDHSENLRKLLKGKVTFVVQKHQVGTANAVNCASAVLRDQPGETLIIMGDSPLFTVSTLTRLMEKNANSDLTVLTAMVNRNNAYGKVVRNPNNQIQKIVEHNQALPHEKTIREVNAGVYAIKNQTLWQFVPYVNNAANNYQFPDIVELLVKNNKTVHTLTLENETEFVGINTREDLVLATEVLQNNICKRHLQNGVTILNPKSVFIGTNVTLQKDVTIYPNNYLLGNTSIGTGSVIYPNCWLENAKIANNCVVESSKITNSSIGSGTTVGPFAHIKQNTCVGDSCRVGAFVEVKNAQLATGVKSAHLTYLGDSEIGENTNIGCGVVTVNYDGKQKHKTVIGKNAFVGSNVNLVAPITVGDHCVVAAGSTITSDVPSGDLAIARSYQTNKPGYGKRYLNKQKP